MNALDLVQFIDKKSPRQYSQGIIIQGGFAAVTNGFTITFQPTTLPDGFIGPENVSAPNIKPVLLDMTQLVTIDVTLGQGDFVTVNKDGFTTSSHTVRPEGNSFNLNLIAKQLKKYAKYQPKFYRDFAGERLMVVLKPNGPSVILCYGH